MRCCLFVVALGIVQATTALIPNRTEPTVTRSTTPTPLFSNISSASSTHPSRSPEVPQSWGRFVGPWQMQYELTKANLSTPGWPTWQVMPQTDGVILRQGGTNDFNFHAIPFCFRFFSTEVTTVYVSPNGLVSLLPFPPCRDSCQYLSPSEFLAHFYPGSSPYIAAYAALLNAGCYKGEAPRPPPPPKTETPSASATHSSNVTSNGRHKKTVTQRGAATQVNYTSGTPTPLGPLEPEPVANSSNLTSQRSPSRRFVQQNVEQPQSNSSVAATITPTRPNAAASATRDGSQRVPLPTLVTHAVPTPVATRKAPPHITTTLSPIPTTSRPAPLQATSSPVNDTDVLDNASTVSPTRSPTPGLTSATHSPTPLVTPTVTRTQVKCSGQVRYTRQEREGVPVLLLEWLDVVRYYGMYEDLPFQREHTTVQAELWANGTVIFRYLELFSDVTPLVALSWAAQEYLQAPTPSEPVAYRFEPRPLSPATNDTASCNAFTTCESCLSTEHGCKWCSLTDTCLDRKDRTHCFDEDERTSSCEIPEVSSHRYQRKLRYNVPFPDIRLRSAQRSSVSDIDDYHPTRNPFEKVQIFDEVEHPDPTWRVVLFYNPPPGESNFDYYSRRIYINPNGFASLDGKYPSSCYVTTGASYAYYCGETILLNGEVLAPFMMDLDPSQRSSAAVHYLFTNDSAIVQWSDVPFFTKSPQSESLTFQLEIFRNNTVKYRYSHAFPVLANESATCSVGEPGGVFWASRPYISLASEKFKGRSDMLWSLLRGNSELTFEPVLGCEGSCGSAKLCNHTAQRCHCVSPFTGWDCGECVSGYYGSRCSMCNTCFNSGQCDDGATGTGQCMCPKNYDGFYCEIECSCPKSGCPACPACDPLRSWCYCGQCWCIDGYTGTTCHEQVGNTQQTSSALLIAVIVLGSVTLFVIVLFLIYTVCWLRGVRRALRQQQQQQNEGVEMFSLHPLPPTGGLPVPGIPLQQISLAQLRRLQLRRRTDLEEHLTGDDNEEEEEIPEGIVVGSNNGNGSAPHTPRPVSEQSDAQGEAEPPSDSDTSRLTTPLIPRLALSSPTTPVAPSRGRRRPQPPPEPSPRIAQPAVNGIVAIVSHVEVEQPLEPPADGSESARSRALGRVVDGQLVV